MVAPSMDWKDARLSRAGNTVSRNFDAKPAAAFQQRIKYHLHKSRAGEFASTARISGQNYKPLQQPRPRQSTLKMKNAVTAYVTAFLVQAPKSRLRLSG
jgi:hypothetical protein